MELPQIIQGGMGVAVSCWQLARSVSMHGQIGVVSGTAVDVVLARRLQLGDPGGHMRRAMAQFPDQSMSERILERYFVEGGKAADKPFVSRPMVGHKRSPKIEELLIVSNFVEVYLAKEGHDGLVGTNFLNKIQTTMLPSLYGAMLAGVDIVIVGAGIPFEVPAMMDAYCAGREAELKYSVVDAEKGSTHLLKLDPSQLFDGPTPAVDRPLFFPIVSSVTLATMLVRRCEGKIDGFVIEGKTAGGHNAPPRGAKKFTPEGEPLYGPRDEIDLEAIHAIGLPFWLAGSFGNPEKLLEARDVGAAGIQVGTLFAFCEESGIRPDLKSQIIESCRTESPRVFTDPVASPTGFPFKVLSVDGTVSEKDVYEERPRICDLGYLREAYTTPNGSIDWRCSSEPIDDFLRKGGKIEETVGRKCVCNGLMANIGMAQVRKDKSEELPLVTCGDEVASICQILGSDKLSYTAVDVLDYLLSAQRVSGNGVSTGANKAAHLT